MHLLRFFRGSVNSGRLHQANYWRRDFFIDVNCCLATCQIIMVEGPGCKLKGEKLKKRVKGQIVKNISGNAIEKVIHLLHCTLQIFITCYSVRLTGCNINYCNECLTYFPEKQSCTGGRITLRCSHRNEADRCQDSREGALCNI